VRVLPAGVLPHLPSRWRLPRCRFSLAFDPDSFYFGLLPVLATAAQTAGGSAIRSGPRAAILGQMTTGFPVSPLTPSHLSSRGLADVDLADHQRRTNSVCVRRDVDHGGGRAGGRRDSVVTKGFMASGLQGFRGKQMIDSRLMQL
jgi:Mg2+/citrate symporter